MMKSTTSYLLLGLLSFVALVNAGSTNKILFGPHTVSYTINNDTMNLRIEANNNGWVAFGFGDSMVNSDIVSVRYDGTNVLVEDRYSTARGVPALDATQNWTLVSGGFAGTNWDVTIQRKLSTGDSFDTSILNGKRYDTLFAIGSEQTFTTKHKFFWEYEDVKYTDAEMYDQDGAGTRLTFFALLCLLVSFIALL